MNTSQSNIDVEAVMQAAKMSKKTKNKLLTALNQLEEEISEEKSKQGMLA